MNVCLFVPDKALTDQRSVSSGVEFGEQMSLLRLLTGRGVTQRQPHHREADPGMNGGRFGMVTICGAPAQHAGGSAEVTSPSPSMFNVYMCLEKWLSDCEHLVFLSRTRVQFPGQDAKSWATPAPRQLMLGCLFLATTGTYTHVHTHT